MFFCSLGNKTDMFTIGIKTIQKCLKVKFTVKITTINILVYILPGFWGGGESMELEVWARFYIGRLI